MPRPQIRRVGLPAVAVEKDREQVETAKSPCKRRSARLAAAAGSSVDSSGSSSLYGDLPVPRRENLFGEIERIDSSDHSKSFRQIKLDSSKIEIPGEGDSDKENVANLASSSPESEPKARRARGRPKGKGKVEVRGKGKSNVNAKVGHSSIELGLPDISPIGSPQRSPQRSSHQRSPRVTPIRADLIDSSPIYTPRRIRRNPGSADAVSSSSSSDIYFENAENIPPGEALSDDPFGFNKILNYRPKLRKVESKPENDFQIYQDDGSFSEEVLQKKGPRPTTQAEKTPYPRKRALQPLNSEELLDRLPKELKGKRAKPRAKKEVAKPLPVPFPIESDSEDRKRIEEVNKKYKKIDEWELNEVIISSSPSSSSSSGLF